MKRRWGMMIVIFALATATLLFTDRTPRATSNVVDGSTATVRMGAAEITAEVAVSDQARSRGLSGRPSLSDHEGMLFVFPQPGRYRFWMQSMLFPLDIIWIEHNRIVDMAEDVPAPNPEVVTVTPKARATYVLEVAAGTAARLGIRVGDLVRIEFDNRRKNT